MVTGELKGQFDRVWDAFWSGGIANPLEVIEQRGSGGPWSGASSPRARIRGSGPATICKVVDLLDQVPMEDRDTTGDLHEYMLGKIATAGFLVAAGEYLRARHPEILRDAKLRAHFHQQAFHGPDIRYRVAGRTGRALRLPPALRVPGRALT